jgi:hypothetical protein
MRTRTCSSLETLRYVEQKSIDFFDDLLSIKHRRFLVEGLVPKQYRECVESEQAVELFYLTSIFPK